MSKEKPKNPVEKTEGSSRVLRGGGWRDHPKYLIVAKRHYDPPFIRYGDYGFRITRTVKK